MNKLGLGIIGTSWITDSFIDAALATEHYELNCVYSRRAETAQEFASKYGEVSTETDLKAFMNNEDLDVVYIASPNSFHYEQSLLALKAGKHVIVEKPASTNVDQWEEMVAVAKENNVLVFEAARHIHDPNLATIMQEVKTLGEVQGATLAYAKYSSRYDNVLAGEEPNIFSLKFAGGVLMDLGIYPVYTSVVLFGKPESAHYFPRKIKTGVDGIGTIILRYEDFDVTILISKKTTSMIGLEVYGETETLLVDHATDLNHAKRIDAKTMEEKEVPFDAQNENGMFYEARVFAEMIASQNEKETIEKYEKLSEYAKTVSGILSDLRKQAGIIFDFEK